MSCLCGEKVSVIIQTNTPVADGMGAEVPSWANTETINAILQPISGGEAYLQGKDSVIANYRMWIDAKQEDRTSRTLTEDQRILYGSRAFKILFVANQLEQGSSYVVDMLEVPHDD
jgi:head-tail adaptor